MVTPASFWSYIKYNHIDRLIESTTKINKVCTPVNKIQPHNAYRRRHDSRREWYYETAPALPCPISAQHTTKLFSFWFMLSTMTIKPHITSDIIRMNVSNIWTEIFLLISEPTKQTNRPAYITLYDKLWRFLEILVGLLTALSLIIPLTFVYPNATILNNL